MPSQFFGLNTAYLGLLAGNASLNVTANNISNVETDGYSRQHTVQNAANALRVFTSYGCVGAGVDVIAIERYRDEFYDMKYWNNQSKYGIYQAKDYYTKQIENYFRDDDEHHKGFSTIYDEVYTALAELKKDAGTSDVRRNFMGAAEKLTDYFNTMYGNLQNMQKDCNSEIKVLADRVNAIASQVVTLNKQINVIEVAGGNANELRDKRALLMDELSEIVDIETEDQDVIDPRDPDRNTRCSRFIVRIAGGQTLVDDQVSFTLNCVARKDYEKVNQSDVDGLYDLVWSNGNRFSLNNRVMEGKLKGLFDMRDGNNGEFFHGDVSEAYTGYENGEKYTYVNVKVEAEYLKDVNKLTLAETGIISIGAKEVWYDDWTMTTDPNTGDTFFRLRLSNENNKDSIYYSDFKGKDAKIGIAVEYQGIPYYMEQMNEWVRNFAASFNDILTKKDMDTGLESIDNYGNKATRMFLYNTLGSNEEQGDFDASYARDENGELIRDELTGYYVHSTTVNAYSNSYYRLTAGNFAVSEQMMKDPGFMATRTAPYDEAAGMGSVDEYSKYDIVDDLLDLKTNVEKMKFRGSSSSSFLQAILSDVALNGQKAKEFATNYENISRSIDTQRMSLSGVDNDEEALSLVKYQNAYNLASKMIQVLTEVYDRLILQTGV